MPWLMPTDSANQLDGMHALNCTQLYPEQLALKTKDAAVQMRLEKPARSYVLSLGVADPSLPNAELQQDKIVFRAGGKSSKSVVFIITYSVCSFAPRI